jgi:DNA-directed RNA polymerase specialized sigma24 family protein
MFDQSTDYDPSSADDAEEPALPYTEDQAERVKHFENFHRTTCHTIKVRCRAILAGQGMDWEGAEQQTWEQLAHAYVVKNRRIANPEAYVKKIARCECLALVRKAEAERKALSETVERAHLLQGSEEGAVDPRHSLTDRQRSEASSRRQALEETLAILPRQQQLVMTLWLLEFKGDTPVGEVDKWIAEKTELAPATVRSHRRRAIKALKKHLKASPSTVARLGTVEERDHP